MRAGAAQLRTSPVAPSSTPAATDRACTSRPMNVSSLMRRLPVIAALPPPSVAATRANLRGGAPRRYIRSSRQRPPGRCAQEMRTTATAMRLPGLLALPSLRTSPALPCCRVCCPSPRQPSPNGQRPIRPTSAVGACSQAQTATTEAVRQPQRRTFKPAARIRIPLGAPLASPVGIPSAFPSGTR